MRNPFLSFGRLAGWTFIFLLSSSLGAEERAGFDILRFEPGARPAALAGAFVAVRGDVNGMTFNPASIASVTQQEITFSYLNHAPGFKSGMLAWARPVPGIGTAGVSVSYLDYGDMDETDVVGDVIGRFSANDWVMTAGLARPMMENLEAGLSVKFIHSRIAGYSASAIAGDAGLIYSIPKQAMTVGIAADNFGAALSAFIDTREKLPMSLRAGVCKHLAHLPLALNFNLIRYVHDSSSGPGGMYWALGGEFTLSQALMLRVGYNSRGVEEKAGLDDRFSGLTGGLGIEFQRIRFDLSFENQGALGSRGQGSLTFVF